MDTLVKPNWRLRQARFVRMWTQKYVANELGVSNRAVMRWEQGIQFPHPETLQDLCNLFEMSAEDLGFCRPLVFRTTKAGEVVNVYGSVADVSVESFQARGDTAEILVAPAPTHAPASAHNDMVEDLITSVTASFENLGPSASGAILGAFGNMTPTDADPMD